MNIEMLDGYLAAIVASPLPIPVEDWLPAVWTADEGEVGFGSAAPLQKAIELVLRYYNDQAGRHRRRRRRRGGRSRRLAALLLRPGRRRRPAIGEEWTNGFEQGFEMWPAEWPDKVSDTAIAEELLELILGPEEEVSVPADAEAQLAELEQKGFAVQHLFQNWRALGLPGAGARRGERRHCRQERPGRNEPCPAAAARSTRSAAAPADAMADPCLSCGACCASFRVDFHVSDLDSQPGGCVPVAPDAAGYRQPVPHARHRRRPARAASRWPARSAARCTARSTTAARPVPRLRALRGAGHRRRGLRLRPPAPRPGALGE